MRWLRTFAVGLALAVTAPASVQAALIADYRGDYLAGSSNGVTRPSVSADGWDYMWNATGDIGTAANYASLLSWGATYNSDGAGNLPRPDPGAYVYLHGSGGHPGRGVNQGGTWDRYAIAGYTLQAGEGGLVRIANSGLSVGSANGNGVELRVYVNNNLLGGFVQPGGVAAGSFNGILGFLNPGDTVYVAMGPNQVDSYDSFGVAYQLETVSDASGRIWDADGTSPINGGTGTWNTTSSRWADTGGAYGTWNNAANQSAIFLADGGTVTLGENITARSLSFSADGYTIAGSNTLALTTAGSDGPGPATIDVAFGTATISAPITGPVLNKIDSGTLRLEGTTTVGEIRAAGGDLVLAGSSVTNVSGTARVGATSYWAPGGSSGTLTIQDSASLIASTINMGENYNPTINGMTAVINQTGGTVTTTGVDGEGNGIRIGHWPNETSTYNLSGGTLTIGAGAELAIAIDGTGIFNQTGGTVNAETVVVNARNNANGNGTFTVQGGTANIGAGGIVNEGTGPATVNVGGAGGTIRATASFSSSLDMNITGSGISGAYFDTNGNAIDLSGSLTGGGALNKVGDGTLTLTGATNSLSEISAAGGTLVLGGSSVTNVSSIVRVGVGTNWVNGGGSGAMGIQGTVQLTTQNFFMGENWPSQAGMTADVVQDGGIVTVTNDMRIGHWGNETSTYTLNGGELHLTADGAVVNSFGDRRGVLQLGIDGVGSFTQTGGEASAAGIVLDGRGNTAGTETFTLNGGTFTIGTALEDIGISSPNPGSIQVNLGGGTLAASHDWSSSLAMTLTGAVGPAVFDPSGQTITLSGTLSGPGRLRTVGTGTLVLTGTNTLASMVLDGAVTEIAGSGNTTVAGYMGIGDTGFATLRIKDTASFSPSQLLVGETGGIGGAVEQTGGTVTIAGETRVGHWPNETSTYTLDDGSLVSNGDFNVGWDGTGIFTQNGGDSQFNAGLDVGAHVGAGAIVNVNGGTMTVTDIMLGDYNGTAGTMNQTDGTVTITGSTGENAAIRIGHWPSGDTSSYNLSGGNFSITMADQDLGIGTDGNGVFHQTGGQADVPGVQVNHRNANGSGTLIVEGTGVMNIGSRGLKVAAGNATLGGTSVTTVSGPVAVGDFTGYAGTSTLTIQDTATLNANGAYFLVGDTNGVPGAVSQTGGTVTIAGETRLAHWPNETSTYTLDDGNLVANGQFSVGWDGTGNFVQNGGSAVFNGQFWLNRYGTYTQNGGDSQFNTGLRIGHRSGGNTATYAMNDGTLAAPWISIGDANGTGGNLVQNGGTINVSDWIRVGHWPNNSSSYTLNDGNLNVGGTLAVARDSDGTLTMNGGTITAANYFLGDHTNHSGTVTQTDGDVTVTGQMRIGHWPNETSTYTMGGGTLTLTGTPGGGTETNGILYIGIDGIGIFTQTGGVATAPGIVLDNRGATGGDDTFTMEGGTFNVGPSGVRVGGGNSTSIAVNLGGGTVRASDSFSFFTGSTVRPITLTGTGGDVTFDTNGHVIELYANLSGPGGYVKTGSGDLGLRGTASHSGTTTIQQGRAIVYRNDALSPASDTVVNGDLDIWNYSPTVKSLSGTGRVFANNASQTFTVGANDGTGSFGGVLQDHTWNASAVLALTKIGAGTQTLTGNNTYTGATNVNGGTLALAHASLNNIIASSPTVTVGTDATLDVTGLPGGTLGLAASQVLRGTGTVAGTIGGQGLVSPGASPGILTATAVDPTGGNDYAFEFRQEDPDYGDPADSLNDVLRLTDPSDPLTADMAAENVVDVYLNVPDLAVGDTFRGGFYTDRPAEFLDAIQDATFNYYIAGAGGSVQFEGVDYFPMDEYPAVAGLRLSTVYDPAGFAGGAAGGFVMQLSAVPEPASLVLAALGTLLLVALGRRLRRKGRAAA